MSRNIYFAQWHLSLHKQILSSTLIMRLALSFVAHMKTPLLPDNELERVCALRSLHILDSAPDERFDRITRVAKKLFNVPIVLISFVDSHRQWFKSRLGIEATETSREISFCSHTILQDEMMMVEDATKDDRFIDNPMVCGEPYFRFYIGYPLKLFNQYNVGTLCLIDKKPRKFKFEEMKVLKDLATMVQEELESMHLSSTDKLTSLSNRRGFLLISEFVYQFCQRENKPLLLLYFDVNNLQDINNNYGYSTGDEVLKLFAKTMLETFRSADVVARLGDDEFCVLCSNLVATQIPKLLKRLDSNLHLENNKEYPLHYRLGFIELESKFHKSIDAMLQDLDKKMYEKKYQQF